MAKEGPMKRLAIPVLMTAACWLGGSVSAHAAPNPTVGNFGVCVINGYVSPSAGEVIPSVTTATGATHAPNPDLYVNCGVRYNPLPYNGRH
jgi:hypothetical protein